MRRHIVTDTRGRRQHRTLYKQGQHDSEQNDGSLRAFQKWIQTSNQIRSLR